jgi:general secretion pathway protein H
MRFALLSRRGFTLFELLVVLVVISLMSAMVIPRLSGHLSNLELKTAAKRVAAVMRYARNKAATEKVMVSSEMEIDGRQLSIYALTDLKALYTSKEEDSEDEERSADQIYVLPEGIRFSPSQDNDSPVNDQKMTILFFPNGSCSGGAVTLVNENEKSFDLTIDPITGKVTISD